MEPTKALLIVQIAVQIIILAVVAFYIFVERKKKMPTNVLDELKDTISKTQDLSSEFSAQVQKRIEIVNELTERLDSKIKEADAAISAQVKSSVEKKKTRKYAPEDIVKMYKGGFEPIDISQITGIPVGEIELMIKLKDNISD